MEKIIESLGGSIVHLLKGGNNGRIIVTVVFFVEGLPTMKATSKEAPKPMETKTPVDTDNSSIFSTLKVRNLALSEANLKQYLRYKFKYFKVVKFQTILVNGKHLALTQRF